MVPELCVDAASLAYHGTTYHTRTCVWLDFRKRNGPIDIMQVTLVLVNSVQIREGKQVAFESRWDRYNLHARYKYLYAEAICMLGNRGACACAVALQCSCHLSMQANAMHRHREGRLRRERFDVHSMCLSCKEDRISLGESRLREQGSPHSSTAQNLERRPEVAFAANFIALLPSLRFVPDVVFASFVCCLLLLRRPIAPFFIARRDAPLNPLSSSRARSD
jgi:hypothetical protein